MLGNVWEWTSTLYEPDKFPYPYRADDGREASDDLITERVLCGGGYRSQQRDLRASMRSFNAPNAIGADGGFRCAHDF